MLHVIREEQMAAMRPFAFIGRLESEAPGFVGDLSRDQLVAFTRRAVDLAWENGITSRKLIQRFLTSLALAHEDLSGEEIPAWVRNDIAVNEWMIDGINTLGAEIRPPPLFDEATGEELIHREAYDEHESWLKLTVYVRKSDAPRKDRRQIASMDFVAGLAVEPALGIESSSPAGRFESTAGFAEDENGDVLVSPVTYDYDEEDKEIVISREISLPIFLPRWTWLDGKEIPYDEETMMNLGAEYMRVWNLLDSGAVDEIRELIQPKVEEYTSAYYLTTEDEIRDIVPLPDLMRSEDLTLLPLPEEVEFEVFGNDRLARLVDEDGDSPIVFANENDVGYFMYLTYHRTPEGWVLTR